jgi:hypothetical protein
MKKASYKGWRNCIRLANREMELIVTTDVGPRVIRLGFVGGRNLFYEAAEQAGKRGGNKWRAYGGHRFWHAPEAIPRSYAPDNEPVPYSWDGRTLRLAQKVEALTGMAKEIEITLDARRNHVKVLHRLVNKNLWAVEAACWGLSVMAAGGRAIFPQEAYGPHPKFMLPARPMVLWPYTDMADRRFTWGTKYVQFRQDANAARPNKIGLRNTLGWAAYALEGEVFVKRFPFDAGAKYVDFGCNNEAFANAEMLEVESLGPVVKMAPGGKAEHVEDWYLFKAEVPESEAGITRVLGPIVRKTGK